MNEDELMIELKYEMRYKDVLIQVVKGDIIELQVDAIVCPTNASLKMVKSIGKVLKDVGGFEIENEALEFLKNYKDHFFLKDFEGSCPIGTAVITSAGKLAPNIKYVIHAPIITNIGEKTKRTRILSAIRGVMQRAYEVWWKLGLDEDSNLCESLAIPRLRMQDDQISNKKLAGAVIDGLINQFNTWFVKAPLKKIILIDKNEELLQDYQEIMKSI